MDVAWKFIFILAAVGLVIFGYGYITNNPIPAFEGLSVLACATSCAGTLGIGAVCGIFLRIIGIV